MAIKLFFKHLFTSIRKRPAQPLILSFVIMIAVVVCVLALELKGFLITEQEYKFYDQNGNANIVVSVSTNSEVRFLDTDKIDDALGKDVDYVGIYAMPFYVGEEKDFFFGVTTDLSRVNRIFEDIEYSQDLKIPKGKEVRSCIYVTREFANEYGLKVYDENSKDNGSSEITLNILGKDLTYKVFGIVENHKIMGSYSVMVDTEGIRNLFGKNSALIGGFKPYGKIFIRTDEDKVATSLETLREIYPGSNVAKTEFDAENIEEFMGNVVDLVVLLTIVFAVITIYACFAILANQRKDENALFYAVGSKSYMLNLLSMAEMFVYWLFGFAVGVALSFPVAKMLGVIADFQYLSPTVSPEAVGIAGGIILGGTELGMVAFVATDKIKKFREKRHIVKKQNPLLTNGLSIGLAAATLICLGVSLAVEIKERNVPAVAGLLFLSVTLFYGGRNVFVKVSEGLSRINKLPVTIRYGIKNSSRVTSQGNVAGLVAMFLVICTLLTIMLNFGIKSNEMYKRTIDADYLVVNATALAKEELKTTEGVDAVYDVFSGESYAADDKSLILVCASDLDAVNPKFRIEKLPEGNEIVLADTYMRKAGYKEGDPYVMKYGGKEFTLTVISSAKMNGRVVFVDADYVGITYNYVSVRGEKGYDVQKLYNNINKKLELYNTTVLPIGNLLEETIETNSRSIESIEIIYIAMLIFAIIGLSDSIVSGYRSRREEFECFAGAGMNKKAVRNMKIAEVVYAFVMGIIMYALTIGIAYVLLDQACLGFTLDLRYI